MKRIAWVGLVVAGLVPAAGLRSADKPPEAAAAGASRTAAEFVRAFNAGDAKAVAAAWTADAELTAADGRTTRGRAALESLYAELFKARPGLTAAVETTAVRAFGPTLAVVEGVMTLRGKDAAADVTAFSAVEVKDGDGWKLASVRAWVLDPDAGALADLDWLAGAWVGKTADGEMRATYAWEDGKAFLKCRYAVTADGKEVAAGTQMIGAGPDGGVRGWLFDRTGAAAESAWAKDGTRWLVRAAGALRSGVGGEATHLLVPVSKDTFTWQSVDRTVGGLPVPDGKPVKMTRVAAK